MLRENELFRFHENRVKAKFRYFKNIVEHLIRALFIIEEKCPELFDESTEKGKQNVNRIIEAIKTEDKELLYVLVKTWQPYYEHAED